MNKALTITQKIEANRVIHSGQGARSASRRRLDNAALLLGHPRHRTPASATTVEPCILIGLPLVSVLNVLFQTPCSGVIGIATAVAFVAGVFYITEIS